MKLEIYLKVGENEKYKIDFFKADLLYFCESINFDAIEETKKNLNNRNFVFSLIDLFRKYTNIPTPSPQDILKVFYENFHKQKLAKVDFIEENEREIKAILEIHEFFFEMQEIVRRHLGFFSKILMRQISKKDLAEKLKHEIENTYKPLELEIKEIKEEARQKNG